jgi:hypothetical protein
MKKIKVKFRKDWNGVLPITKVIPNKKLYSRKEKFKKACI